MDNESLIKVHDLYRYYGNHCAVGGVSFEVQRGEVLGFLGPNGAGKSTSMQMITGNLAPTSGSITIGGIDMLDEPKAAKALIGYLPEQPPLYRDLTVDEFLRYCAHINRISKAHVAKAVENAKTKCGLGDVGKRLINNLSKGYQQRVGIAQAIIHSPEVVILDEPTVGLDPIQIREIRNLIRELGGEHSVILSTHILPEVQATCDRVQIINRGKLVVSDTIQGLSERMRGSTLTIALHRPPTISELEAIDGVDAAEIMDEHHFRLRHGSESNPAEAVAVAAVQNNWGLYQLMPENRSLEDIFVDITTADVANEEEAA